MVLGGETSPHAAMRRIRAISHHGERRSSQVIAISAEKLLQSSKAPIKGPPLAYSPRRPGLGHHDTVGYLIKVSDQAGRTPPH